MILALFLLAAPPQQVYQNDPVDRIISDLREVSRKVDAVQSNVSGIREDMAKTNAKAENLERTVGELKTSTETQGEKINELDRALAVMKAELTQNGFQIGGTTGLVTALAIVLHNLRTRKRINREIESKKGEA